MGIAGDKLEDRRAGFVDALLNVDKAKSVVGDSVTDSAPQEKIEIPHNVEEITVGTEHSVQSMFNILQTRYWKNTKHLLMFQQGYLSHFLQRSSE